MQIITDDDLLKFIGTQESQFIGMASDWKDEVIQRMNGEGNVVGNHLPWSKTHNCVALRPGEVSVWAGVNGHGKSQILGMIAAWGLHSSKWLIASMEMLPSATMHRMIRQVSGTNQPANDYAIKFMDWTDGRLWIYDQTDSVEQNRILGMVHFCAQELGINHIIIDSLVKCGIKPDDYSAQKEFVDRLCWAAKANRVHIHLVHHIRKGDKEGKIPDKFDIKGAGEITDLVDNVFIVHRNKIKEEKIRKKIEVDIEEPDCILKVSKQRHGEWEGAFNLWFHHGSLQYTPDSRNKPIPYRENEL